MEDTMLSLCTRQIVPLAPISSVGIRVCSKYV